MRWMLTAAMLLPGLPALAQENEAEKLFRAMEKKVREADGLKTVFSVNGDLGKDMKMTATGYVVVAKGNKIRVEVNAKQGKQDIKLQMYADGKLMAASINGKFEGEPKPAEGNMTEAISQVTARGGVFVGLDSQPEPEDKAKFDIDKFLVVSDFKL